MTMVTTNCQLSTVNTCTTLAKVELTKNISSLNYDRGLMRSIRNMEPAWLKVNGGNFSLVEYRDKKGQLRPCYSLTKTECLYIATKFNDEARCAKGLSLGIKAALSLLTVPVPGSVLLYFFPIHELLKGRAVGVLAQGFPLHLVSFQAIDFPTFAKFDLAQVFPAGSHQRAVNKV